jgi:hypothetical protein
VGAITAMKEKSDRPQDKADAFYLKKDIRGLAA